MEVSVIMPVYNEKPEYLKDAIESILNQTYSDYEFIIVDDASDSYVKEIVFSYKDKRIKYGCMKENSKICKVLNSGISASIGDYVAIMHSDDVSFHSRLQKQVEVLDKNPNVGLVSSYTVLQKEQQCKLIKPYFNQNLEKLYLKYIGCNIVHSNVMLRKSVLTENSLRYNAKFVYAEDYRLWVDMIPYCDFYVIPEALSIYNLYVNPNRQNYEYTHTCRKVILLENYASLLNLPKEKYQELITKLWDKRFKYIDYLNVKTDVYEPMLKILETKLSSKLYYSFKHKFEEAIEDYNPYKKG